MSTIDYPLVEQIQCTGAYSMALDWPVFLKTYRRELCCYKSLWGGLKGLIMGRGRQDQTGGGKGLKQAEGLRTQRDDRWKTPFRGKQASHGDE